MSWLRSVPGKTLTAVLAVAAIACAEPPTTPEVDDDADLPPLTLDWVGFYAGTATGTADGVGPRTWPVDMFITFDASPSPTCEACVTVRLVDYFNRTGLFPQSAISATWSYQQDGVTHTLTLQKFSTGSTPGGTLLGSIEVEGTNPDGTPRVDVMATLSLERVS